MADKGHSESALTHSQSQKVTEELHIMARWQNTALHLINVVVFVSMTRGRLQLLVEPGPGPMTVPVGQTVVLKCTVQDRNGSSVSWSKNGYNMGSDRTLPNFPRFTIEGKDNGTVGVFNLVIAVVKQEDKGTYSCNLPGIQSKVSLIVVSEDITPGSSGLSTGGAVIIALGVVFVFAVVGVKLWLWCEDLKADDSFLHRIVCKWRRDQTADRTTVDNITLVSTSAQGADQRAVSSSEAVPNTPAASQRQAPPTPQATSADGMQLIRTTLEKQGVQGLLTSCSHPGDSPRNSNMHPTLAGGSRSALNRVMIPFMRL